MRDVRQVTDTLFRPSRYSEIRNIPQRTTSTDSAPKAPSSVKKEKTKPNADSPAQSTSKIDVNAIPTHKATGKPITQVNIDEGKSTM
jgi:pre-mRNA 3'-end-processing factor FIP1